MHAGTQHFNSHISTIMKAGEMYLSDGSGSDGLGIELAEGFGNGPRMIVVGLPDAAVKESRDRVMAALDSSGFKLHDGITTVNLAPANIKKEGPAFDLPIAVSLVAVKQQLKVEILQETCMAGELALNGELRPVRGLLAIALEARARGRKRLLIPKRAAAEASVVAGIDIIGVNTFREAVDYLLGYYDVQPEPCRAAEYFAQACSYSIDFADVKGQVHAKRAIEVAVCGGHNLLMVGPPGAGKSMLAARLPSILPALNSRELLDVSMIQSIAGELAGGARAVLQVRAHAERPARTGDDHGMHIVGIRQGAKQISHLSVRLK